MSTKFKLISFPEAKKRIERKKFWKSLWDKLFVRKTGFDKYVIASWGMYTDNAGVWVCAQNKDTGKVTLHRTGIITENEETARKALILYVGKLK